MSWSRWTSSTVVVAALFVGGMAAAGESPTQHQHNANSPSDVMMEQCMGPEGHRAAAENMDRVHGAGTHERMHGMMDQTMTGMMGMMGGSMGPGSMMEPHR